MKLKEFGLQHAFQCTSAQGNFDGCSNSVPLELCGVYDFRYDTAQTFTPDDEMLTAFWCYAAAILVKPKRELDINVEGKSHAVYDTKYKSARTPTARTATATTAIARTATARTATARTATARTATEAVLMR